VVNVFRMAKQKRTKLTVIPATAFEVQRSFVSRVYLNGNLLAVLESDSEPGLALKEKNFIEKAVSANSFQIDLFKDGINKGEGK